jgi:hypothetical protein
MVYDTYITILKGRLITITGILDIKNYTYLQINKQWEMIDCLLLMISTSTTIMLLFYKKLFSKVIKYLVIGLKV